MRAGLGRREGRATLKTSGAMTGADPMFATSPRLSILGLVIALAAVVTTPVLAGSRCASEAPRDDAQLTVELARGVVGNSAPRSSDTYAPTGESIDLTVTVNAT